MGRPLIGITLNSFHPKNGLAYDKLAQNYIDAVILAGGMPVLLPNAIPLDEILLLRERLEGILLTGGGDIAPERFGGVQTNTLDSVSAQRDELEFRLVQMSVKTDWPLLGICRGVQVMNVALVGTLYTDIPTQYPSTLLHDTPEDKERNYLAHEVTIAEGTVLSGIVRQEKLKVNSFHHQAVKQAADCLHVSARAADGLVEGLELPGLRFFVGVQWHPECLGRYAEQRALFEAFIRAAGKH